MYEYRIEYLCNGNHAVMVVLANAAYEAAKWACKYEKSRGNAYTLKKIHRVK